MAGNGRCGKPKREWEVFVGCQVVSVEEPDGRQSRCGGRDGLAKTVTPEESGKRAGAEMRWWQAVIRPWRLVGGVEW